MRVSQHCFAVAAIASAMVLGGSAGAQTAPCLPNGMIGSAIFGIGSPKGSAPFSGVLKNSFEQKLADGNAIHRVTLTRQARDSGGRTMTEMAQGCMVGEDGQMHSILSVRVNDTGARTNMNWQVGLDIEPKVAHVFHQPEPTSQVARVAKQPEPTPEELARRKKMREAAQAAQMKQQREDRIENLGVKDFNGVSAQGMRTTRTIPAGEEGNDQPLVVVNENWRSKELGLVMMAIHDDPRTGRTVSEYEEFTRGEPDPGLFMPPPGYTVQEQPQTGTIGGIVSGGIFQQ